MKNKQIKVPVAVHSLIVRSYGQDLHEKGHSAYWVRRDGAFVHGPIGKAPLHAVIDAACTSYFQALNPDRADQVEAGDDARAEYLEGLNDPNS